MEEVIENNEKLLNLFTAKLGTLDNVEKYLLLNFSKMSNVEELFANTQLKIDDFINYTNSAEQNSVDFFETISLGFTKIRQNIIYFCNNIDQVKNNLQWFNMRNKDDIILDLCGNAMHVSDLANSKI